MHGRRSVDAPFRAAEGNNSEHENVLVQENLLRVCCPTEPDEVMSNTRQKNVVHIVVMTKCICIHFQQLSARKNADARIQLDSTRRYFTDLLPRVATIDVLQSHLYWKRKFLT